MYQVQESNVNLSTQIPNSMRLYCTLILTFTVTFFQKVFKAERHKKRMRNGLKKIDKFVWAVKIFTFRFLMKESELGEGVT